MVAHESHTAVSIAEPKYWVERKRALVATSTTPEINTSPPRLVRDLLLLAEGQLLTPSRSLMIVFAAWGPELYLCVTTVMDPCNHMSTQATTGLDA